MLASLTRLLSYWESLRTSFWFLPSIMAVAAIALSSLLVDADSWVGDEAMKKIRARESGGHSTPMIALTADALEENHNDYIQADADIVVTKPVNWQTLIAEMNRLTQQPNAPIV